MASPSNVKCMTTCIDLYSGFYRLRHVQPFALTSSNCVACNLFHWLIYNGFYKLRHVQPFALTCTMASTCCVTCNLLHWHLQAASSTPFCIGLYTMASTSCVKCYFLHRLIYSGFYKLRQVRNLLLWIIYNGFYKLRHVQPLELTCTVVSTGCVMCNLLH